MKRIATSTAKLIHSFFEKEEIADLISSFEGTLNVVVSPRMRLYKFSIRQTKQLRAILSAASYLLLYKYSEKGAQSKKNCTYDGQNKKKLFKASASMMKRASIASAQSASNSRARLLEQYGQN